MTFPFNPYGHLPTTFMPIMRYDQHAIDLEALLHHFLFSDSYDRVFLRFMHLGSNKDFN